MVVLETYIFLKGKQYINDVPLKCLTFQTRQIKYDGESNKKERNIDQKK